MFEKRGGTAQIQGDDRMIPDRFVTEYPARCMDLFDIMERVARERDLLGSFSLIVATSVFLVPYERMKSRHPLHRPENEGQIDEATQPHLRLSVRAQLETS
jgi:formate hydrogenlyase subunit 4